ncbi:MAG: APC family permease [Chloroflexi bacterium]|nr:APC family permease [Chloroflexota bacterium]
MKKFTETFAASFINTLFGKPLATHEEGGQRVDTLTGVPLLGLDALASAAYGPEAALTLLIPLGALGLAYIGPIAAIIIALLTIVYLSYRQTIAAYPTGGGSYTVARTNLGMSVGLLAAAALMLDYVLVVAVGISAGVGALVSALPILQPHTLLLCLVILGFIVVVNLRGTRESGLVFILPTYLFIGCLLIALIIGILKTVGSGGHPIPVEAPPTFLAAVTAPSLWLLLQAFASGCTAMTGVEAVSNGVTAFREPATKYAQRTLTVIIATLGILLAGIALLVQAYGIGATLPGQPGYESVLSQLVAAVAGRGVFYYITIGAILAVLAFSANTGFADFPRLCRVIAQDGFLPHAFAHRGRRLAFSQGIVVLAVLAGTLLIVFGGVTDHLIPLFAVGAFLAFTLSQAGMVAHWRKVGGRHARRNMLINGVGAVATGITLGVVLIAKFAAGAWITLLLIPIALFIFIAVKRHYRQVKDETDHPQPLDLSKLRPPLVVVPVRRWDTLAHKSLRFALKLSPDVYAVQVRAEEQMEDLETNWARYVEAPTRAAGLPTPKLVVLSSPYRQVFDPLLTYIAQLKQAHPDRQVAVIIPELVERHWYHYLLHNQQGELLKTLLLRQGDQRIIIINVPWYLAES